MRDHQRESYKDTLGIFLRQSEVVSPTENECIFMLQGWLSMGWVYVPCHSPVVHPLAYWPIQFCIMIILAHSDHFGFAYQ